MQEEDAAAAGYCARLCETLRGAEAFAESDGLDAFISVAMGQSMKGNGGLMVALAQALAMDMTPFKEAVFETLCAAAQWPSLKGRIAGSGVLGVITATLLSPRHPATVKALMVRLCGLLAADSLEAISLGDARRAEEFSKLRGQLISSGAIKAIVGLLAASEGPAAAAAATAVVQLALAGDAAIRTELLQADAATVLLRCAARLSKAGTEEMSDSDAETEEDAAPEAATAALARLLAFDGDGCQETGHIEQSAHCNSEDWPKEHSIESCFQRNCNRPCHASFSCSLCPRSSWRRYWNPVPSRTFATRCTATASAERWSRSCDAWIWQGPDTMPGRLCKRSCARTFGRCWSFTGAM